MRVFYKTLFFLFCFVFAFGCAFFQGERNAEVLLVTKPDGAFVYKIYTRYIESGKIINENSQFLGQTPIVVEIPKDSHVMVVLAKQGFKNKEFIIRTGYKVIYMDDGKHYQGCMDENLYAWATGNIYNKIINYFAHGVQEQYCSADRYQYKLELEKL